MTSPSITILLPYAEHFSAGRAGAIALCVRDATAVSRFRDRIRIIGRPLAQPFSGFDYAGLEPAWGGLAGRNLGLAERLLRLLGRRRDVLVEVHNRPKVFRYLAMRAPDLPLALHLHNDPTTMQGARSAAARARILRRALAVCCVSGFVRDRFVDGVRDRSGKTHVLFNGTSRALTRPPVKERTILFVGRLIEDKGPDQLVDALVSVLPRHPDWRALIIGSPRPGPAPAPSAFESRLRARAAGLGDALRFLGFLPHEEVQDHFRRAAIVVVPSVWQEPFGRTAIEGLAAGCAVIAYDRGGLGEIVRGRGLLLERPGADALTDALERLIGDEPLRESLQSQAWRDCPFGIEETTARHDDLRGALLERLALRSGLPSARREEPEIASRGGRFGRL
jgi:glycosyltransferase involved in cell wall biosynthesis